MLAIVESITITNVIAYLEEEEESSAYVSSMHHEVTVFVGGGVVENDYYNRFILNKQDGKWLICEIIDETELYNP